MHAEGEPEEFVAAAIAAGLDEYGIACHAPVKPEPFDDWRMLVSQLPDYFSWIERARAAAGDKLAIRCGLECDWLAGCEDWISELRASHPWDYLIGSVHYIGDQWDFDNPKWLGRWEKTDVDQVWQQYWATYIQMVDSGLFDILGHADLIKKFAYQPAGDLDHYYEPVIDAIAASGSILEINTAGWHKPCAEAYPSADFLTLAADAGIDIVISSDAHAPAEIARDFAKARQLAKSAGFSQTVKINRGQRSYEAL